MCVGGRAFSGRSYWEVWVLGFWWFPVILEGHSDSRNWSCWYGQITKGLRRNSEEDVFLPRRQGTSRLCLCRVEGGQPPARFRVAVVLPRTWLRGSSNP